MIIDWKNDYYRYQRYFFDVRQRVSSPKFRSFTWLSITVFTVSFFLIVAIRPTLVTIAKLQKEINDKETASEQLQNKINSLVKTQAEMVNYLDDIEKLNQSIPEVIDYNKTAETIENIALANNVSIKSLTFEGLGGNYQIKDGTGIGNFLVIPFNATVTGGFYELRGFLSSLENSKRIPIIDRNSFTTTISETGNQLALTITGNFLYQGSLADRPNR